MQQTTHQSMQLAIAPTSISHFATQFARTTFGVVAAFVAAGSVNAQDAAMFRGGPTHLGQYTAAAAPTLARVAWKFKTGARVVSSPAVVGNVVYVGSNDHNLYAINAADGTQKWKFATKAPVNSSPAVVGGVVYFGSVDGKFYALDAATGTQKWSFATGGERRFTAPGIHGITPRTEMMPDPFDVFLSSPVVDRGVVYFGSGDFHVYALDANTGTLKWKFKTGNVVHASPAIADGSLYVGSWDAYLYSLDAATGKMKWKFEAGRDTVENNQVGFASSAAIANGVVYVGCRDGFLYAVDAKTGTLKWKHDNKHGWVIASPAVHNGVVFFPTSDGTRFKALDALTGTLKFDNANKAVSFSSPAIAGGVAVFGSSDGWLHAVDIKTGATTAEFQTDGSKENASRFISANGKINYAAMYPDQTLDGTFVGQSNMFLLGAIVSSPVVSNGVVYVGSGDGNVYAIR